MTISLPKFNLQLSSSPDKSTIPGHKLILVNDLSGSQYRSLSSIAIDTRDNSLNVTPAMELDPYWMQFYNWLGLRFKEFKKTNFKFGTDEYDPTEQMLPIDFLNYLKSKHRDDVIESLLT